MPEWIGVALGIVNKTMGFLEEKQRQKIMREYHDLLEDYNEAKNKVRPDYTDIEVDLLEERLVSYLKAYGNEFK